MDKQNNRSLDDRESSSDEPDPIPKIGMINPGFRDVQDPSLTKYKSPGPKLTANRLDQKNRKYLILAILIVIAVIGILEYKQMRDAKLEPEEVKPASLFR